MFFSYINSKEKNNQIRFKEAKFSEDGIVIKSISMEKFLNIINPIYMSYRINSVLFALDGSESILNKISIKTSYESDWDLFIETIKLFDRRFEVKNLYCKNDKTFFLTARKISNLGKLSVFDVEIGYTEPMGWKVKSNYVVYKNGEVFCLGNKIGFGKAAIPFFDFNLNVKNGSGFICSGIDKDFNGYKYLSFGYYFLSKDERFDFTISPMLYLKDLGLYTEFRDLVNNIEVSLQAERGASYFINKILETNEENKRNLIVSIKANNSLIDANFSIFNTSLYDTNIWRSINYKNFSPSSKDYWGYLYINLNKLQLSALQRNHEQSLKGEIYITNFLKIRAEKTFKDRKIIDLVLYKQCFLDLDLFLFDVFGNIKYGFLKNDEFKLSSFSIDNVELNSCVKVDLPMFSVENNIFRSVLTFELSGEILDTVKYLLKKTHINKKVKLNSFLEPKIGGEIIFYGEYFDSKVFFYDEKNFGIELSCFTQLNYVDSIAVEKKDDQFFMSFMFLEQSQCFGFKISYNQLLLELVANVTDLIKFKLLGTYSFNKKFWDKNNFYDRNTGINFEIEILMESWKISFLYGIKNMLTNNSNYLYQISVVPKVELSFSEIEEIFNQINLEKDRVLNIYNDFN